ncbi:MAG: potassium channel protein [Syntrophobacterales bacterium]|nr:MAG: potassium channel protein [Syntrophobacterales bacterium]
MSLLKNIKKLVRLIRKDRFFLIAILTVSVVLLSSVWIYLFEHDREGSSIRSVWDGIWWAVVTICTVGYGDKLPSSDAGKIVGLILMISGIFLLSMITATIASVFVEQKIREGKGLKPIKERDHIIICGWNQHTEEVLAWLNSDGYENNPPIALVNELAIDDIDALKLKYDNYNLNFIRGNYIHEDVLLRADVRRASCAILMADFSGVHERDRADERTILSALTIKALAPKMKIVAELLNGENRAHLMRANVDEVIVRGEHLGSLLASAVHNPGLPGVFSIMLSPDDKNKLVRVKIPEHFIGKTFKELSEFYRKNKEAIVIGLMKEKESMKLEDMLSDDTSAIDRFIREKIKESKKELFYEKEKTKVIINPGDEEVITVNDYAVILSKETTG